MGKGARGEACRAACGGGALMGPAASVPQLGGGGVDTATPAGGAWPRWGSVEDSSRRARGVGASLGVPRRRGLGVGRGN